MFKKLFSILPGKSDQSSAPNNVEAEPQEKEASQEKMAPEEDSLITVYDAYGKELRITRKDWREKILIPNMDLSWNDAEKLYGYIISAFNDGLFEDVDSPSERLLEIDDNTERSHTIRAITLMHLQRLDEAHSMLSDGIKKVGRTAVLLTNLAKVYSRRGDNTQAEKILWEAVQADPNQDNGLLWWLAIQNERHGIEGYLKSLRIATTIKGGWRPQLWLARHEIESGNVEFAKHLYQQVLSQGQYTDDGLMMMSGDLGNNRHEGLIIELVAPVYDPNQHGFQTGLNLLEAYLRTKRMDDGEALLNRLYTCDISPIKESLDRYAIEFDKIRQQGAKVDEIEDLDKLNFQTVALDKPIWMYGLKNPTWFYKEKPDEATRVTFVSLNRAGGKESDKGERQREDDVGRMSRAIPLYLAEAVHNWTPFATRTLIPTVNGCSPVLSGGELNGDDFCAQVASDTRYLVIGTVGVSGDHWNIRLEIWDCIETQCKKRLTAESTFEGIGQATLKLEKQLISWTEQASSEPFDSFYSRPTTEAMNIYLSGLSQNLTLTLISAYPEGKNTIWGERNMLEWSLNMALQWPISDVYPLMYLSSLGKASNYKSDVLNEFQRRTMEFMRKLKSDNRVVGQLEPFIWMLFDPQQLRQYKDQLDTIPNTSKEFEGWVKRLSENTD